MHHGFNSWWTSLFPRLRSYPIGPPFRRSVCSVVVRVGGGDLRGSRRAIRGFTSSSAGHGGHILRESMRKKGEWKGRSSRTLNKAEIERSGGEVWALRWLGNGGVGRRGGERERERGPSGVLMERLSRGRDGEWRRGARVIEESDGG